MINLHIGTGPKFTVDQISLPFTGVDIGQLFNCTGTVKLDAINPEGPTYVFEVLELGFPEMERGTLKIRKAGRKKQAQAPSKKK